MHIPNVRSLLYFKGQGLVMAHRGFTYQNAEYLAETITSIASASHDFYLLQPTYTHSYQYAKKIHYAGAWTLTGSCKRGP